MTVALTTVPDHWEDHSLDYIKAMANLDSVSKSRDIALPTKIHTVKAVVSPVVTDSCESWTVMKAKR